MASTSKVICDRCKNEIPPLGGFHFDHGISLVGGPALRLPKVSDLCISCLASFCNQRIITDSEQADIKRQSEDLNRRFDEERSRNRDW